MKSKSMFFMLMLVCSFLSAQSDFVVTCDSLGQFYLAQNGQKTPFDTAYVAASLSAKIQEEQAISKEIELLERVILLRRSQAVISEERKTLQQIINQARNVKK